MTNLPTGLGSHGVGEIVNKHNAGDAGFDRVAEGSDEVAASTEAGSSSSAPVHGDIANGVVRALSSVAVTAIRLEYGTTSLKPPFAANRADNWLHGHGDLPSSLARDIRAQLQAVFSSDKNVWNEIVFERVVEVPGRPFRGLARS